MAQATEATLHGSKPYRVSDRMMPHFATVNPRPENRDLGTHSAQIKAVNDLAAPEALAPGAGRFELAAYWPGLLCRW